jgi:hypothetical protein
VTIYRNDIPIGTYKRTYPSNPSLTFYPFQIGEDWYALYSGDYTTTRVFRLYDDHIEDWCGEAPNNNGFCPVEFYVPYFQVADYDYCYLSDSDNKVEHRQQYVADNDKWFSLTPKIPIWDRYSNYTFSFTYAPYGFVSGCVWGDDSSWKIRYIDLSQVPNKEVKITEKFGYFTLPDSLSLKECVSLRYYDPKNPYITLTRSEEFDLREDVNEEEEEVQMLNKETQVEVLKEN